MLVANLAINFQDLVAKVKNLVTLVPVLLNDYYFHFSFMVENDSHLSDFTVKTAFFSRWNRVFSHTNNLTSLWYLSCKGAVKNRVDRVAAPYLGVLETSLHGVWTVFQWWKAIPSTQISPLNSFLFLLKQGLPSKNRYQSDSKSIVVHKQRRSEGMLLLEWLELNWVIVLWSAWAA